MTRWVVVGAGAAGCVTAGRLAEAGHAVTVVEAGAATRPDDDADAALTGPFDAMARPGAVYPGPISRGRGVGGSSLVNGLVATAGDLDQYRRWGWTDAEDALARVRVPATPPADGELGPLDRALLAAAPDAAVVALTRRAGRRVTAADAYLGALGGAGTLDVVAGTAAVRLERRQRTATGVALADGRVIPAERVAVAAGALGTPPLLAASAVEHPALGRGLRNHPGLPVGLRLGADADVDGLVTGTLLRRGDVEVVPLNHLGRDDLRRAMLLVVAVRPGGAGRVGADGAVTVPPLTGDDRTALAAGLDVVHALLADGAFAGLLDGVAVGRAPAGVHHPTSTCPIGVVADDDGLVDGFANVHVVDASAFPDIPAANTYLPTLMLAERLAARLRRL